MARTDEQKSLNGMLRSILWQLVLAKPNLTLDSSLGSSMIPTWSTMRLLKTTDLVLEQLQTDTAICLVIDGLDEFEGDLALQDSLLFFIKKVSQRSNSKVLLSSRPEPLMMDTFGKSDGLRLQDLTEKDITNYINGRLFMEERMQRYIKSSPKEVDRLVKSTCSKADGVFLWAHLAVQDLVRSLRERDSLETLHIRLDHLDSSLDGLFAQLIKRIHPTRHAVAANYIKFVSQSQKLTGFHFAFVFYPSFKTLVREFLDSCDPALYIKNLPDREELMDIPTVLASQTAGLIHASVTDIVEREWLMPTSARLRFCSFLYSNMHVEFVHRSVSNYISSNSQAQLLLDNATISDEDMQNRILCAIEAGTRLRLRLFQQTFDPNSLVRGQLDHSFSYFKYNCYWEACCDYRRLISSVYHTNARLNPEESEARRNSIEKWLLKEIQLWKDNSLLGPVQYFFIRNNNHDSALDFHVLPAIGSSHLLMYHLIESLAFDWVSQKLKPGHKPSAGVFLFALLKGAMAKVYQNQYEATLLDGSLSLVTELFSLGIDPNAPFPGQCCFVEYQDADRNSTLWELFLFKIKKYVYHRDRRLDLSWDEVNNPNDTRAAGILRLHQLFLHITRLFLDHKADIHAFAPHKIRLHDWEFSIRGSALHVIHEFMAVEPEFRHLASRLEAQGAKIEVSVIQTIILYDYHVDKLKECPLTDAQQRELWPYIEKWRGCPTCAQMCEVLELDFNVEDCIGDYTEDDIEDPADVQTDSHTKDNVEDYGEDLGDGYIEDNAEVYAGDRLEDHIEALFKKIWSSNVHYDYKTSYSHWKREYEQAWRLWLDNESRDNPEDSEEAVDASRKSVEDSRESLDANREGMNIDD